MSEPLRRIVCSLLIVASLVCTGISFLQEPDTDRTSVFVAEKCTPEQASFGSSHGSVNINLADMDELVSLPGIGETIASLIIEERTINGPFYYPEDLLCVRGIGEKKLESIRPFLETALETED